METKPINSGAKQEEYTVFVISNNPAFVDTIHKSLVMAREAKLVTEFAFDLRNTISRIRKFKAASVVIDDTMGHPDVLRLIKHLRGSRKTRNIAITLVKSTNREHPASNEVDELLLFDQITTEGIVKAILNSVRFRKYREYYGKYLAKSRSLFRPRMKVRFAG